VRKYYIFGKAYLKSLMDVHVFSSLGYEKVLGRQVDMRTMLALAWLDYLILIQCFESSSSIDRCPVNMNIVPSEI
jgi:hypothetical protein